MNVWRGWGGVSFVFLLLTGILGIGVPSGAGLTDDVAWWILLPVALAMAGLNYALGMHLNRHKPPERARADLADLEQRIDQTVAEGTFALGPGHARPSSYEEARAQADAYLQEAQAQARKTLDQHRLFWIPMQHWSWVILAFALFVTVMTSVAPK